MHTGILACTLALAASTACILSAGQPAASDPKPQTAAGPAAPQAKAGMPVLQFIGHDSKITERRFSLISDETQWNNLWVEHTGSKPTFLPPARYTIPVIDFTRYCVVAAFDGSGVNTDGLVAESITPTDQHVRFRFTTSSFQTASVNMDEHQAAKSTSYGIWIMERTEKPIILERAQASLKDGTGTWAQVATFTPKP